MAEANKILRARPAKKMTMRLFPHVTVLWSHNENNRHRQTLAYICPSSSPSPAATKLLSCPSPLRASPRRPMSSRPPAPLAPPGASPTPVPPPGASPTPSHRRSDELPVARAALAPTGSRHTEGLQGAHTAAASGGPRRPRRLPERLLDVCSPPQGLPRPNTTATYGTNPRGFPPPMPLRCSLSLSPNLSLSDLLSISFPDGIHVHNCIKLTRSMFWFRFRSSELLIS